MTTPPRSELGGQGRSEMQGGVDGAYLSWVSPSLVAKSHLNWCELFHRTEKGAHVAGYWGPTSVFRSRSRAPKSGGPPRWAWRLPGWRKATKMPSKIITRSRCGPRPLSIRSTLLCEVLPCATAVSLSQKQPNIGNSCSAQE